MDETKESSVPLQHAQEGDDSPSCSCEMTIELPTARHAEQICAIMAVDKERGTVTKDLTTQDNLLKVNLRAATVKLLRAVVSGFYDTLLVSLKCYQEFDDSLLLQQT